ncbi:MAG: hypothetical protein RIR97_1136 [Pseudomonadota bacterium]
MCSMTEQDCAKLDFGIYTYFSDMDQPNRLLWVAVLAGSLSCCFARHPDARMGLTSFVTSVI